MLIMLITSIMENNNNNTFRIGIYMFLTIVAFFFVTKIAGLEQYTELRLFNIFIILYFSNRLARLNLIKMKNINYLNNLGSVFIANLMNVVLCSVSFFSYLTWTDPGLIKVIENSFLLGHHLTARSIVMALMVEGLASSIIVSFGVLQYWKSYKIDLMKSDISQSELG